MELLFALIVGAVLGAGLEHGSPAPPADWHGEGEVHVLELDGNTRLVTSTATTDPNRSCDAYLHATLPDGRGAGVRLRDCSSRRSSEPETARFLLRLRAETLSPLPDEPEWQLDLSPPQPAPMEM